VKILSGRTQLHVGFQADHAPPQPSVQSPKHFRSQPALRLLWKRSYWQGTVGRGAAINPAAALGLVLSP